jgi:glycosyltransferase involved in cell wall biosynthesis
MRVLVVNALYPPYGGGAEIVCAEYAEGLRERGHEIFVVARREANVPGVLPVLRTSTNSRLQWILTGRRNARAVRTAIRRFRPDIAYVHNLDRLTSSVFGACDAEGVSVVAHLHNFSSSMGSRSLALRFGWGVSPIARPQRVIAVSSVLAQWASSQGVPETDIEVVHNGLPDVILNSAGSPEPRRFERRLLYAGVVSAHKGTDLALQATLALGEQWRLDIIGKGVEGFERRLSEIINETNTDQRCRVLPQLSREDISRRMTESDIVLIPSRCDESFCLVAIEAMLAGAIVIASNRGALPEVVGDTGIVVEADNTDALVAGIKRVEAMSDEERLRLRRKAFERVRREFRLSDRIPIVERILKDATERSL